MSDSINQPNSKAVGQADDYVEEEQPSRLRIVLLVLLVVAVAGGFFAWRYNTVRESTDDAQVEGHVHPLSPRVGGTIVTIAVRDNQYVNAGDVLVQLDPKDYEVAVAHARADVASAEAGLSSSETEVPVTHTTTASGISEAAAGVSEAQAGIQVGDRMVVMARERLDAARANVDQVKANYDRAAKDVERFQPLVAKEEISRQQFDAAVSQADALKAALTAARAQVAEAETAVRTQETAQQRDRAHLAMAEAGERRAQTAPQQIAISQARARSSAARVALAKATLAQAELNLQYTTIKAPVAGIVSNRGVESGQVVQPGQPLLDIVPTDELWVVANFKETQLRSMKPGQRATVEVDVDGHEYEGHVESFSGATGSRFSLLPPENATGNFVKVVQRVPVKIVFEPGQDKEHRLRPGLSVEPTVYTRQ
jgi:membrane fusion protein (multidrug efflux system)